MFQLLYFGMCFPAFMFQFIPFMKKFKIQQVNVLLFLISVLSEIKL